MCDRAVSVGAVMMTALRGAPGGRGIGKYWGHWEVRNHYGWWWIRACTPRN
jgi:hypothetical protein